MKKAKKCGPKPQEYSLLVRISEIKLSELEIARLEKILFSMLVKSEEEVANVRKSESRDLLPRLVG